MKIIVNGAPLTLSKADYLASGGEGDVYIKGSTAYKLYHEPQRMIPVGKIGELQAIQTPAVVKPTHVIYSDKNAPIGYTMPFVPDAWTLCQLFTRTFRDREGLTADRMAMLIQQLRAAVTSVHAASVLVVDLNEMNGIVTKDFATLYLLDADSFQTPHYPATALMESVRDRHSKTFTPGTDWFAYGILTFQMFVGIHPYKGKHASLATLDARMQANISVLNATVKVPQACYPFNVIPPAYRSWYEAVFERGMREAPPMDMHGAVLPVATSAAPKAVNLTITVHATYAGVLHTYLEGFGRTVVASTEGVWLDRRQAVASTATAGFDRTQQPFVMIGGVIQRLSSGHVATIQADIKATTTSEHDVYVQVRDQVYRVQLHGTGTLLASLQPVLYCMEHATKLFEGCAIQNMLGEPYVSVLTPGGVYSLALPELKGYRVLDARRLSTVLVVVAEKKGSYYRFVFRFDPQFASYDVRLTADVGSAQTPNFAVTDSQVVVLLNEDDALEVFSAKKDAAGLKVLTDPSLRSDMKLITLGGRIGYLYGDSIYSMRL